MLASKRFFDCALANARGSAQNDNPAGSFFRPAFSLVVYPAEAFRLRPAFSPVASATGYGQSVPTGRNPWAEPGGGTGRLRRQVLVKIAVGIDYQRNRPLVDQLDIHHRLKDTGFCL